MNRFLFSFILLGPVLVISCRTPKNIAYFGSSAHDTSIFSSNKAPEYIICSNDLLYIGITCMDEDMVRLLNSPNTTGTMSMGITGNVNSLSLPNGGFLVDKDGFIHYPLIGKIRAAGLSKSELIENLQNTLITKNLVLDPVIDIRIQNYRVTVLGEVAKPGVIVIPNEKISLPEALGMAGDLTIYGQRNNVMVVREENNFKVCHHLNLGSDSILSSPYYYLRPNDLVYVEPGRIKKHASTWASIYLPAIISGAVSVILVVFTRLIPQN